MSVDHRHGNREMQEEELGALRSIYADEFTALGERTFQIALRIEGDQDNCHAEQRDLYLYLQFTYHDAYPSDEPPYFSFETKNWKLGGHDIATLRNYLVRSSHDEEETLGCYFLPGECCVFQWVEHLRNHIAEMVPHALKEAHQRDLDLEQHSGPQAHARPEENGKNYFDGEIHKSEPYTDRKSKFVAHAAEVHSEAEARAFMDELLQDNKIANATHNILAYRIELDNGMLLEHRDDDGETGAAENILFLLQRGDVRNMIVCLTRWYGGIQLGPDRFKIITNIAKELLQDLGALSVRRGKSG